MKNNLLMKHYLGMGKKSNEPIGYIKFEDTEVEKICVQNFSSDGLGVTYKDAKKFNTLGNVFQGNTSIKKFNELPYFSNVKKISFQEFDYCSNLESIDLSNIEYIEGYAFRNNTKLIPKNTDKIISVGEYSFQGCNSIISIEMNNLTSLGKDAFQDCVNVRFIQLNKLVDNKDSIIKMPLSTTRYIESIEMKSLVTGGYERMYGHTNLKRAIMPLWEIPSSQCNDGCTSLKELDFKSAKKLSFYNFRDCTFDKIEFNQLEELRGNCFINCKMKTLIIRTPKVATLDNTALTGTTCDIYVPDNLVESYKTAPNWSNYADKIKPLSTYVESTN